MHDIWCIYADDIVQSIRSSLRYWMSVCSSTNHLSCAGVSGITICMRHQLRSPHSELSFKAPVTVGSLLQLTTAVTFSPIQDYSSHRSFQVSVEAATIKIHSGEKKVTNTFHYTFSSSEPLQRYVLPENYADGLDWLESMRRRETGAALRKVYSQ